MGTFKGNDNLICSEEIDTSFKTTKVVNVAVKEKRIVGMVAGSSRTGVGLC